MFRDGSASASANAQGNKALQTKINLFFLFRFLFSFHVSNSEMLWQSSYFKNKQMRKWWTIITVFTLKCIWEAVNDQRVFKKEVVCWRVIVDKVKYISFNWEWFMKRVAPSIVIHCSFCREY